MREQIPGAPEGYMVDEFGKVFTPEGRELMPYTQRGYKRVVIRRAGLPRFSGFVHRFVLGAFVGPCPPGHQTRHLDGDPSNNNLSNLRWGTVAENAADRVVHGRSGRPRHLSPDQVRFIRSKSFAWGDVRRLADQFGVSPMVISRVKQRKSYKHVH